MSAPLPLIEFASVIQSANPSSGHCCSSTTSMPASANAPGDRSISLSVPAMVWVLPVSPATTAFA